MTVLVQVQAAGSGPKLYKGPVDVVKVLYKEGGIRSIYKGTCATLLRGVCVCIGRYICVCLCSCIKIYTLVHPFLLMWILSP